MYVFVDQITNNLWNGNIYLSVRSVRPITFVPHSFFNNWLRLHACIHLCFHVQKHWDFPHKRFFFSFSTIIESDYHCIEYSIFRNGGSNRNANGVSSTSRRKYRTAVGSLQHQWSSISEDMMPLTTVLDHIQQQEKQTNRQRQQQRSLINMCVYLNLKFVDHWYSEAWEQVNEASEKSIWSM